MKPSMYKYVRNRNDGGLDVSMDGVNWINSGLPPLSSYGAGFDPTDPSTWHGLNSWLPNAPPTVASKAPPTKAGDVLKVVCKKCGNEGHVTVWKVADGKVHATCKLCGKEVVQ